MIFLKNMAGGYDSFRGGVNTPPPHGGLEISLSKAYNH
jgi:hypothetical protein